MTFGTFLVLLLLIMVIVYSFWDEKVSVTARHIIGIVAVCLVVFWFLGFFRVLPFGVR